MGKATWIGSLPEDHPIFTGRVEVFSHPLPSAALGTDQQPAAPASVGAAPGSKAKRQVAKSDRKPKVAK